jgi:organic hydroperoxide reductase OsmC/OhrA
VGDAVSLTLALARIVLRDQRRTDMNVNAPQAQNKTGTGRRAPFPHVYDVTIAGAGEAATLGAAPRPDIEGGAPETFGGRADWWSPEHLLLASLGLCLKTTFDSFAAKDKLAVARYASDVQGVLDKSPAGLVFTSFTISVELHVAEADVERARTALDTAKRFCLVSNALKTPVEVRSTVRIG